MQLLLTASKFVGFFIIWNILARIFICTAQQMTLIWIGFLLVVTKQLKKLSLSYFKCWENFVDISSKCVWSVIISVNRKGCVIYYKKSRKKMLNSKGRELTLEELQLLSNSVSNAPKDFLLSTTDLQFSSIKARQYCAL